MDSAKRGYLTLIGPESVMEQFNILGDFEDVEISSSQPFESLSDAVDAPLGPDDLKLLLEFATVSFGLGVATIKFIMAVKDLLGKKEKTPEHKIIILDARSNKLIIEIEESTDVVQAAKRLDTALNIQTKTES